MTNLGPKRLHENTLALLNKANVNYREVVHAPVLTYEQAEEVRTKFALAGKESKSLFLRFGDLYAMFITLEGQRLNSKALKEQFGRRPTLCTADELIKLTGCVPQCACPFGLPDRVQLIVDPLIFECDKFIFSPGPPERSIEINGRDIPTILEHCSNKITLFTP